MIVFADFLKVYNDMEAHYFQSFFRLHAWFEIRKKDVDNIIRKEGMNMKVNSIAKLS